MFSPNLLAHVQLKQLFMVLSLISLLGNVLFLWSVWYPKTNYKLFGIFFSVFQSDIKSDGDRAVVRSAILKDFALNSTSESRRYVGSIAMTLSGEVISIKRDMIQKVLHRTGLTARILGQNYADVIRQLIKMDSVLGAACLDNYRRTAGVHIDKNHSDLCFDCASFCTALSNREAQFNRMVSTVKFIQAADDVKEGRPMIENSNQSKNLLTE